MNHQQLRHQVIAVILVTVLLMGCESVAPTPENTPTPSNTPTPVSFQMNDLIKEDEWVFTVTHAFRHDTALTEKLGPGKFEEVTIKTKEPNTDLLEVIVELDTKLNLADAKNFSKKDIFVKDKDGKTYPCSDIIHSWTSFALECESLEGEVMGFILAQAVFNKSFNFVFTVPENRTITEFVWFGLPVQLDIKRMLE